MKLPLLPALAFLFCASAFVLDGAEAPAFFTIAKPAAPDVAYSVRHDAKEKKLVITIAAAAMQPDWPAPRVNIGVAYAKKFMLTSADAKPEKADGRFVFRFPIDTARLAKAGEDLAGLRWAFDVAWLNPAGEVVQRENFFVPSSWPAFRPIGDNPADWAEFSLAEHEKLSANLRQQLRVSWNQPFDGKASVVIEDGSGRRVRNLVSGRPFSAGQQTVVWDGFDEAGKLVAPGKFTWRVASHPGIKPDYLMSFYNPGKPPWKAGPTSIWMGDHTSPTCAASNGELVALGCPVAESGNNIVLVDQQGNKLADGNLSAHSGIGNLFLAMDGRRFYALSEGAPQYDKLRKDESGKDYIYASLSLYAWGVDGQPHPFPATGRSGDKTVREYKLDPAMKIKHGGVANLRGAVALGPNLYLSLHDENKIQILNSDTGEPAGEIAVAEPGLIATDGKSLLVQSGPSLALIENPASGAKSATLFPLKLSAERPSQSGRVATALAFNPKGEIFVADNGVDQNVKVFDRSGKLLRQIGHAGGRPSEGKWASDGMRLPLGIALDGKGQLWVAENESEPKRISVWDSGDGHLVREIFGPTCYGASGGGFDQKDASQWIGGGSRWMVDLAAKSAAIESVLYFPDKPGEPTVNFRPFSVGFVHRDGRTFLISKDAVMRLFELKPDGTAKLWAMFSSLHGYEADHPRWWVPEAFTRHPLLKDVLADFTEVVGPLGDFRNGPGSSKLGRELSVLWTDVNGDDIAQVEELQVVGTQNAQVKTAAWGYQFQDLDWKLAAEVNGKAAVAPLKLHGFLPSGAPDWRLQEALDLAVPVEGFIGRNFQSYATDSASRFLINADPMTGVAADGKIAWTFPNSWTGVHGSHDAPLPETGVMQGALSYLGVAPLDAQGDVTVINGNHGRFFIMTTDGMYLDEMFQDVRLSRDASAYRIGGEVFGGYFGRDEKTGRYLLQSGHSDYRIFELKGLDKVTRSQGTLEVTPTQILAAQKTQEKQLAESIRPHIAAIGSASDVAAEWGDPKRPFPYVKVSASRDGGDLILSYDVKDPSPWVNQGTDQQLLFKSGDCVVFEFSTDPKAAPKRAEPVAGDKRLLIAPFQDKPVAVLYDYKVPGTAKPVPFNSPSRSAMVDRVTVLDHAKITVKKATAGYVLAARIPLADLGLPPSDQAAALKGDFGVIYGDEEGRINILRSFWSNRSTGLVNDVPGETMINPALWGQLEWK